MSSMCLLSCWNCIVGVVVVTVVRFVMPVVFEVLVSEVVDVAVLVEKVALVVVVVVLMVFVVGMSLVVWECIVVVVVVIACQVKTSLRRSEGVPCPVLPPIRTNAQLRNTTC